jgi:SAM-dependent methyltransferase
VQPYQKNALDTLCSIYDVKDKAVLEVGSNYWTPGQKVVEALREKGARLVIGITNEYRPDRLKKHRNQKNCYVFCADACLSPFNDGFFDAVFMNDVLEHLQDIKGLFKEVYRVLKPGGIFFSASGPLWEGGTGHHLIFSMDGKNFTLRDGIIPPFFHLRLSKGRMIRFLEADGKVASEHIDFVTDWIYKSTGLNRLYVRDYIREIKGSGFEVSLIDLNKSDKALYYLLRYCPRFIVKSFFRKSQCTLKMDFILKKADSRASSS